MASRFLVFSLAIVSCCVLVNSQISTPCSPSMITSFTPCLNFLTNSTTNGSSTPTSGCCNSLKSITSSGTDCICMLLTGGVPFQIPINQSLAISLPRACRMPGVPVQCKAAAGAPIPQPGPAGLGPAPSPSSTDPEGLSPTSTPESSTTPTLAPPSPPESDTTPVLTPPSTAGGSGLPSNRPTVTPSTAASTYAFSPFIIAAFGALFMFF